ncbi:MAG: Dam family site-specific DNA-(adenine-N6)-methyltransferase [Bacteroidales bacterium]|nr:Dam family site-specific DNA-(adenine-N6)-methyltransferase [Bacteroidales bacterium]
MKSIAKPFVKWVGGKGQLLSQLENHMPKDLYEYEFTYIEPFVGGGAMLFFMLQKFPNIKRVVINDINRNLTDAYMNIKENAEGLVYRLKHIEQQYFSISDYEGQRNYYLEMREKFNEEKLTSIDKTAILIFLNRTCFNGLYRENSKGKFNVPFGRYTNPTICNEELIYADSKILNQFDVEILCGDFSETSSKIDKNGLNFFYFDPPYRPLSSTSSFNSYVKEVFDDNEQKRLANFCKEISKKRNCLWMLSNADCSAKNPEDLFFEEIYSIFEIQRVYASRSVNANASKRGKLSELLINSKYNYNSTSVDIPYYEGAR